MRTGALTVSPTFFEVSTAVAFEIFRHANVEVAIVEVDGTADTLWSRVSVDAIAQRAPYGEWTEEMIRVLGEKTEITFTFHYQ